MDRRNNYPRRPNIRSAARPSYDGRPLPAEVYYRRRRLAALFALLVIIGVVATLLFIRSNHESATVAVTEPIASTPRATGGAPATPTGSRKATSASGGGAGSEPAAEVATEVFGADRVHRADTLAEGVERAATLSEGFDAPLTTSGVLVVGSVVLAAEARALFGRS